MEYSGPRRSFPDGRLTPAPRAREQNRNRPNASQLARLRLLLGNKRAPIHDAHDPCVLPDTGNDVPSDDAA